MSERKLATVQMVEALLPIEGADKIELLKMAGLGWQCVVQKGIHAVGNLVIYCEIDSFVDVSRPYFDWLEKNAITWEGKRGARIKSMRLRGQISQGIILPLHEVFCPEPCTPSQYAFLRPVTEEAMREGRWTFRQEELVPGLDVTDTLGVLKWEKAIPANLAGKVRGNFPSHTPKTDEERIQNIWPAIQNRASMYPDELFEQTEKLEGSSMTVYFDTEDKFGVCSRNLDLEDTPDNTLWNVVRALNLQENLTRLCLDTRQGIYPAPPVPVAMSLQGELVGPGVQGNHYGLKEHRFYVFNIYDIQHQRYLDADARRQVVGLIEGLMHVPYLPPIRLSELGTYEEALKLADGPSLVNPEVKREGLVFKSRIMNGFTFKIVSDDYLIATGN